MLKLISTAMVVGLLVCTVSQDASAGRRRCRQHDTVWYSPAPVTMATPAGSAYQENAPAMAQSGNGYSYRSFSYDSSPNVQMQTARPYRTVAPSESRFFRADRKMHGLSWYSNQ